MIILQSLIALILLCLDLALSIYVVWFLILWDFYHLSLWEAMKKPFIVTRRLWRK